MAARMDPAEALPALPLLHVFRALDAGSLGCCACVSRAWQRMANNMDLWESQCQELWRSKAYVPESIVSMADRRAAWLLSQQDAHRTEITEDELCTFTWNFSFKQGRAPFYDTLLGYHRRLLPRYFHRDHTLTAPKDDPLNTFAHTPYTWALRAVEDADSDPPVTRLHIQVNHFPYLHLSRTPDWGWLMENMWVVLTSDHQAGNNPGKGNEGSTSAEVLLAWLQMVGIGDDSDNEDEEEEEEEEGGEGEQQQGDEAEEEGADGMEEDGEQGVIDLEFEEGDGVEVRGGVDGEIGDEDMRLVVPAHR